MILPGILEYQKKTIYNFFKDKNELIVALTRRKIKDDECQIKLIINESENVIDEMINMTEMF